MRRSNPPFNFTQRSILARPVPERGRATYHDTQVHELGLMIYPTGRRTFFWFRRARGNRSGTHFTTIGPFPDISIDKARDKARELSGQLARAKMDKYKDGNPFGRSRDDLTFVELLDAYCERHVRARAKNPTLTEKRMKAWADCYLKQWKSRKLRDITRAEVLDVFNDLGKTRKVTANQTVRHLRLLFNFAASAELWRGENPAARIPLFHDEACAVRSARRAAEPLRGAQDGTERGPSRLRESRALDRRAQVGRVLDAMGLRFAR